MSNNITLVECPRDAMQGWKHFIPTEQKVEYLNALLKVGFDILDCGSFVSAKAIPQMVDTKDVIPQLMLDGSSAKLLTIVANTRGAEDAVQFDEITYLGFPFSISETFQLRNTNKTIAESLVQVEEIQNLCVKNGKQLVVYISMGFGNPYGDEYNAEVAIKWVGELAKMGIRTIALADTVGVAEPANIKYLFNSLIPEFKDVTIGAHFHSTIDTWQEKVDAAWESGCRSFDSAIRGIGGCPMAKNDLVGNLATENLVRWTEEKNIPTKLDKQAFEQAWLMAANIFL